MAADNQGVGKGENLMIQDKPTLCWNCKNATADKCDWVGKYKPIDGWIAENTEIKCGYCTIDSYLVIKCPNFQPDKKKKPVAKPKKEMPKQEIRKVCKYCKMVFYTRYAKTLYCCQQCKSKATALGRAKKRNKK